MNHRVAAQAAGTWSTLTVFCRIAMLAPDQPMHPNTRHALLRRGLIDEHGAHTEMGRLVIRHRPVRLGPVMWIRGPFYAKPIITVHLPEEVPA